MLPSSAPAASQPASFETTPPGLVASMRAAVAGCQARPLMAPPPLGLQHAGAAPCTALTENAGEDCPAEVTCSGSSTKPGIWVVALMQGCNNAGRDLALPPFGRCTSCDDDTMSVWDTAWRQDADTDSRGIAPAASRQPLGWKATALSCAEAAAASAGAVAAPAASCGAISSGRVLAPGGLRLRHRSQISGENDEKTTS